MYIQWTIVLVIINVSIYSKVLIPFDKQGGQVYYKTQWWDKMTSLIFLEDNEAFVWVLQCYR